MTPAEQKHLITHLTTRKRELARIVVETRNQSVAITRAAAAVIALSGRRPSACLKHMAKCANRADEKNEQAQGDIVKIVNALNSLESMDPETMVMWCMYIDRKGVYIDQKVEP